jgi:uncharacterized protein
MKSLRFILPITALATAAITIAQNEGKDPFAVPADVADKIKAALPASTPAPVKKKHEVLVFTKTTTFRHQSIPVAVECLKQLGAKSGLFTVTHSENPASFEPDSLKKYDAVIFANSTGTPLADKSGKEREGLTPEQNKEIDASEARRKEALVAFVKGGKGIIGIHSGGDTYNDWDTYAEMLGTGFMEHPWNSGDTVRVKNLDPQHPLNASFKGEGLTIKDEIYKFKPGRAQPKDRRMLLALDANGTDLLKDDKDKDGKADRDFYPIAWINTFGQGRAFYCSLGHNNEVYWNPAVVEHYLAGIQYALGELPADAAPKPVALVIKDGKLVAAN